MLEVDGFRRNYSHPTLGHAGGMGSSSDRLLTAMGGPFYPIHGHVPRPQETHPIKWPHATRATGSPLASGQDCATRSDEEEDDDEYRPFTPPPPRERLSYTRYQLELLNGIYNHVRYPNSTQKQLIAKRVGITREQVKIWFQNRRRKDVVNKDKPKTKEDNEQTDDKSENGDSDSGVSDTGSSTEVAEGDDEQNKSMVPTVVLKSVIAELNKFDKDFKPKKKTKKRSKAAKEQKTIREKYASALIQGGFDVINPPNRVVPSAATGHKSLNHSSQSSAFQSLRDSGKNTASISSFLESLGTMTNAGLMSSPGRALGQPGCDLPVLSDLLRPNLDNRNTSDNSSSTSHSNTLQSPYPAHINRDQTHPHSAPVTNPYSSPLGYFYPYPFIAEPAFVLSSVRHPEAYRAYGHGIYPPFGGDMPYQTLCVSQISNPYFSSVQPVTPLRWNSHNHSSASSTSESSYEQL